jgi:hypothetical protein
MQHRDFDNLKIGDKVLFKGKYTQRYKITSVISITKTLIKTEQGSFNKKTGYNYPYVQYSNYNTSICFATEEEITVLFTKYQEEDKLNQLRDSVLGNITKLKHFTAQYRLTSTQLEKLDTLLTVYTSEEKLNE